MAGELMDVYVIRLNERLSSINIEAELVAQREWMGTTHYALDLRRGNSKAYRFRSWKDLSKERTFERDELDAQASIMVQFFKEAESEDRVLTYLIGARPDELDLVQQLGERGYLKIPNGDLMNPHFLETLNERDALPGEHRFLPYARLMQAGLAGWTGLLISGSPELHITDEGRMARFLLKEGIALHVLARFGRMFHHEMRKKYPQMNRETKVTDIRLPKPTPPSWRHIEPGVGEVVLRFEEWRSSAGELFRVAYVPETNTVYVPITSDHKMVRENGGQDV